MTASGGSTIGIRPSKKSCSKPVAMPPMVAVTSRPIMNSWSRPPLFFSRNSTVCPALTSMTSEPKPYSVMLTLMCASGPPLSPEVWPPPPQAAARTDTARIIAVVDRITLWTFTRGMRRNGSRIDSAGSCGPPILPPVRYPLSGVLEPSRAVGDHHRVALTQRDRDILDFERSWWTATSPKDVQIREQFELSATRYYSLLTDLLEDGEAMSYDPLVVRRLLRQRDRRRRARIEPRVVEDDGNR